MKQASTNDTPRSAGTPSLGAPTARRRAARVSRRPDRDVRDGGVGPAAASLCNALVVAAALALGWGCDSNPTPHPQDPDARIDARIPDVSVAAPEPDRNDPNQDYTEGADAEDAQPPWANAGCDAGDVEGSETSDVGPMQVDGFDGEVGPDAGEGDEGEQEEDCGRGARGEDGGFGSAPASEVGGRGSAR